MDVDTIAEYYVDLLIFQYRNQPKARATIDLLIRQLLATGVYSDVQNGFALATAVGVQLDTVGKYIGVGRNIGVTLGGTYFSFVNMPDGAPVGGADANKGFRSYTNSTTNASGLFKSYIESAKLATQVDEYTYKQVIRLKALTNVWDGTHLGAQYVLKNFLAIVNASATGFVNDSGSQTAYSINGDLGLDVQVILPYLPRKVGTKITMAYTKPGVATANYTYPA